MNPCSGRNKVQDVWSPAPFKVVKRINNSNTYVAESLDEEGCRKTVYRTDLLHAKNLVCHLGLPNSKEPADLEQTKQKEEVAAPSSTSEGANVGNFGDIEDSSYELVVQRSRRRRVASPKIPSVFNS